MYMKVYEKYVKNPYNKKDCNALYVKKKQRDICHLYICIVFINCAILTIRSVNSTQNVQTINTMRKNSQHKNFNKDQLQHKCKIFFTFICIHLTSTI